MSAYKRLRNNLQWFRLPEQRYMRWAILLSVAIHIMVLAWQREVTQVPAPTPPLLEMILVNAATESTPVNPTALAQANIDGGGEAQSGIASNNQERLGTEAQNIVLDAMTRRRLQLEAEQKELLTLLESKTTTQPGKPAESFLKNPLTGGQDQNEQQALQRNAALTAVSEQIRQYNQRPRKHFDAPSAKAHKFAAYIDDWRNRIEQTGTKYYPGSANNRVYGSLQASITINAEGKVIDVTIDRPSNQAILNQSVRRIVSLAGPFASFTPEMRKQIDQLVITRTWHFVNGNLQTKAQ